MASTYNLLSLADPEKGTSIRGSSAKSSPYETARESLQGTEPKSNVNAFMSCGAYTVCSVGMVMANKAISTSIEEDERKNIPQMSVICFQCIVAVIFVEIAKKCKYVEYPDFDWSIARAWLPLNILFIGMLATGFLSLVYNNVPMVTVFKNLTNVVTITGDVLLFKVNVSWLTLLSVGIMVLGAVLAGANDLEFSWIGYICMGCNCIFTAGYVLYMRFAATNINLPKFGMVYYNNLLSVMLLAPLIVVMGEIPQLFNVLSGDMSLVGPRPCLLNQRKLIKERKKRGVHKVKPGITGLAQISGINMKTPTILSKTDSMMINRMSLFNYFYYILETFLQIIK